jgi:glycosyltransferase involved in cell wall biosynthesis
MEPLITVIVPIFNVQDYLNRCIDSILNQTYKNLEIILIDDGSTDSSGNICDKYAVNDFRISVIHKENEGPSVARNIGIAKASGEFISFIDSDDYIAPNMIEFLYDKIKTKKVNIAICGRYYVFENGYINAKGKKNLDIVMNAEDAIRKMCSTNYFDMSCCDRLFEKSLFDLIRFPEYKLCEDWCVIYKLFDKAKKISYNSTPLYYYYQRRNSNSRDISVSIESLTVSRQMLNFVKIKYPHIVKHAAALLVFTNISVYDNYIKYRLPCNSALKLQIKINVQSNISSIITNNDISIIKKVQALVFCLNFRFYHRIYKWHIRNAEWGC